MRKTRELGQRLLRGIFVLMLTLCIFGTGFLMTGLISHAETQVKVTSPKGANIRQEASASSTRVGGAENGEVLKVLSQVQGSDGYTWYQVEVSGTKGYIRSDLVEATESGGGDTTPAGGNEGGENGEGGEGGGAPSEVTAVNPISASVSGESGKIRDQASSEGQILAEVPTETVLTVTGQATAADGRVWYQVSFISGETQVDGFIRSDFVTLSGELTPVTEEPPEPEEPTPPESNQPDESAPYEVRLQDGDWLLVVKSENKGYSIEELFGSVKSNSELAAANEKTAKNQKIIIIVLVFLLVAAAAGIAFLVFKIRDMMDSAYYNEVENETLRKKNAAGGRGDQKAMHSVGTEKQPARPTGARPAGAGQRGAGTSQGQRPGTAIQGQRPSGASQGQRGTGAGQSTRPATGASQGQRSAGSSQGQRSAAPGQSTRPVGSVQRRPAAGQRPEGGGQGQRSAGAVQGQRGSAPQRPAGNGRPQQSAQRVQPKNFLEEDDEFEFEFLNYDGDEE